MLETCADIGGEMGGDCAPAGRRKRGPRPKPYLRTLESLDGRTVGARRARELASGFEAEMGGSVTEVQRAAILRAATLIAIAEDARARRLAGEQGISLEDLVRVDGIAMRAVRQLGLRPRGQKADTPTIKDYLKTFGAASPGAPPASGDPSEARMHQRPPQDDGEASGEGGAA
jgi:hypothetical protein